MKRLLVRASACSGLLAIAVFAVLQASRQQPAVMAQERQPQQTTSKKKKTKTPVKKPAAKPAPAADRYAERYADRPIEEMNEAQ